MALLTKDLKVLIADDSANMLRTLANMLRALGFEQIIRAEDGDTALIKMRGEKVDLVLCDWNMPRMKGIEVLRAMRDDDQLRHIPMLMISGEVDQKIVAEAGEIDVDGYLLKPFTMEELKAKIEGILKKKQAPTPLDVHLAVADVYMKGGQYEEALEELRKAMRENPRSPRVSFALGQWHETQNDLKNARRFYLRAVEFGHNYLKGHEALARIYQTMGDLQEAAGHLKKAVAISPKNIDRQITLGQVLLKSGQKEEVQEVLQNVMKLADKNKAEVARQVGEIYLDAGMAAEAQEAFTQALEADPTAIHLYNRIGIALRRQKKYDEAVAYYRKAIQMAPEDENLYYNLGRAYYDAGDREKAALAMKRALKIYPDFEEAKDFLDKISED